MLDKYYPPPEISVNLESMTLGRLYPYAMHRNTPIAIVILYTLFILRINPHKRFDTIRNKHSTESLVFKSFVIAHNIGLTIFSAWTLVSMITGLVRNLQMHGWYVGICDLKFTMWNAELFQFSYYFYLSKYYEFIDTLIILYKGKRASTLQIYHHAGAVITMWSGCYYLAVPIAFFVIVNSAIHTWMYAFYTLTALGIRPPGKQLLTSSQIFQFIFGISICFFYLFCPGCENERQKIAIYINLIYLFPLLGLFVSFFINTYINPKKEKML